MECARTCHCGAPKDHRAAECMSCGMSRKTRAQWADSAVRQKMMEAIIPAAKARRQTFERLRWGNFRAAKLEDGRLFARYTDDEGRARYVYRYQWVWIRERGPIPSGMLVHHKDHDPTNDVIENLDLLTASEHARLHGQERTARVPTRPCETCGAIFSAYKHGPNRRLRFCSQRCWYRRRFAVG